MKFSALRRVPPGLFDNTSSWILKERLLPASSRMNEQKKKGDAFRSAAAEEESSHRSSFPTSTTFFSTPVVLLIIDSFFFFLFHLLLHDEILVPSLFITPVPKKRTEKQVWLLHQDSYDLLRAFFFFFDKCGRDLLSRLVYIP